MKTIKYLVFAIVIIASSGFAYAQKSDSLHKKCMNIPNLTEDQKLKIENIHKTHKEAMKLNRKMIEEKNVQLQEMRVQKNPDMNALNAKIDEISLLKSKMMKEREAMIQEIRKLLNDEQLLFYDKEMKQKGDKHKGEMGKGKHCPAQK